MPGWTSNETCGFLIHQPRQQAESPSDILCLTRSTEVNAWCGEVASPDLPVQANTRDAVLTLLLEQGEAEAGDLARTQGISVQAMRRQLRSLAEAGLVEASTSADGPGRPSNPRLTNHGRRRFPDASDHFAWGCSTPCELRCRKPCANFSISRRKPRRSATGINSGRGPAPTAGTASSAPP